MFYYAEINSEYQVVNKHCLTTESTNPNYILITEDLYNNGNELGDIVGQFYNKLLDVIEIVDPGWDMGQTCWMRYKDSQMRLSTKLDNMEYDINNLANGDSDNVSQDDLQVLEDIINTKADATHTHTEYSLTNHNHNNYATVVALDALSEDVSNKADVNHNHNDDYASTSHTHSEYSEVGHSHSNYSLITHNHNSNYSPLSHSHTASEIGAAVSGHNHDSDYASISALDELSDVVSGKANTSHSHDDRYFTETEINNKLANKADSIHNHNGVYDASGSATNALSSANAYTDGAVDTLGEIVSTKANASDLSSHTGNTTAHISSTERTNWNAAKTHANSAHAPVNAEENQNAFSNVVVNGTTISADTKTDTLTFVAGNNVTITPDVTGDSITISSANTVYSHPTTSGNKHIPSGGSNGQILRWGADGTAVWGNDNNTTYSAATTSANGLMSASDKSKLDGMVVATVSEVETYLGI